MTSNCFFARFHPLDFCRLFAWIPVLENHVLEGFDDGDNTSRGELVFCYWFGFRKYFWSWFFALDLVLEIIFGGESGVGKEDTGGDGMGRKLDTLGRWRCAHHGHDECCPYLLEMTRKDKGSNKEQGGEQRIGVVWGQARGLGGRSNYSCNAIVASQLPRESICLVFFLLSYFCVENLWSNHMQMGMD